MPIPVFQETMLPLLEYSAKSNKEISTSEAVEALAEFFSLTEEELNQMLPSGLQSIFLNLVGWASTYMKKAGLLEHTRRGYYRITKRGFQLLKTKRKKSTSRYFLNILNSKNFEILKEYAMVIKTKL